MASENGFSKRKKQIDKETNERRAYIRKNRNDFSPDGRVFILVGGKLPVLHLEGWYFITVKAAKKHGLHFSGKEKYLKTEICIKITLI